MRLIFILMICGLAFGQELEKELPIVEKPTPIIFKTLTLVKDDYKDEYNRGTVAFVADKGNKFNPEALKVRNYSFHKLAIPDGTTIKSVNFTQKLPHTVAITGKNLTFIECNLKNVEIDKSWILIDCLSIHAQEIDEAKDGKTFTVYKVEKDGIFTEVSREEIISDDIIDIK